jgi:D-alanyl-lipoteichoic acid acyltransferase DltB (MBOAT superfamily)
MLFNSFDFAVFLPVVFLAYWYASRGSIFRQNLILLVASYIFYGWWDWRFLTLIAFSSAVDYYVGRGLAATEDPTRRKRLLAASLVTNLGLLAFFKYFNFFIHNAQEVFRFFGSQATLWSLSIALPVGISFYTFQTLSYSIDVYKKRLTPASDPIAFFAFVSFFPQLVAGPIERATNLLGQFQTPRRFDPEAAYDGMRQILWGLFKKLVVADNCAPLVSKIFASYQICNGATLWIGTFLFAFQIYCDFSGYSDIAIGTARLFGFNLMQNFAFPYFSRDIAEFWRRWHISLSTWFRDYLYIPLGGSRGGTSKKVRNTMIIFLVSGFWHGANWTFLVWGALNGLYFLPLLLGGKNRTHLGTVAEGRWFPSIRESTQIAFTFASTLVAWVFFRAPNVSAAITIVSVMFSPSAMQFPHLGKKDLIVFPFIGILLTMEWIMRHRQHGLHLARGEVQKPARWLLYLALLLSILAFGGRQQEFIYFQF